jgi:endonuclease/exonuclease/phosphatase family metal-dependent hydrolase
MAAKKKVRKAPARARRARKVARREAAAFPATLPVVALVRAPKNGGATTALSRRISVATYNVHRWTGLNGRSAPDPARAAFVISELRADVIALQEVLRPYRGDDPLQVLADGLGLHVAFAATRVHRFGELGNAILTRGPMDRVSVLDLSFSRMERRLAVAVQLPFEGGVLDVVATHLAIGDRTRHRQVRSLLDYPDFHENPTILLGDMNAWRQCKATRALDDELRNHHNLDWPASFPSTRPVLSLDRIYSRGARVLEIGTYTSGAARQASDHLPVIAHVELP